MDLQLVKTKDIREMKDALKEINATNQKLSEEWLSNKEAAMFFRTSTKTLYRYRVKGQLPYAKRNSQILFKKSDLVEFMNNRYNKPIDK
jgi:hypothetical protein